MPRTALAVLVLLATGDSHVPAAAAAPAKGPDLCAGARALDALDTRTPLPLAARMASHQRQNMREHLLAVQEIVGGAAIGDFAAVEAAAGKIGFTEEMGRMCQHMGQGAPGFTEQALKFHHTADGIAAAARKRDQPEVLRQLAATLQTCTACHATFKQRVVE